MLFIHSLLCRFAAGQGHVNVPGNPSTLQLEFGIFFGWTAIGSDIIVTVKHVVLKGTGAATNGEAKDIAVQVFPASQVVNIVAGDDPHIGHHHDSPRVVLSSDLADYRAESLFV